MFLGKMMLALLDFSGNGIAEIMHGKIPAWIHCRAMGANVERCQQQKALESNNGNGDDEKWQKQQGWSAAFAKKMEKETTAAAAAAETRWIEGLILC